MKTVGGPPVVFNKWPRKPIYFRSTPTAKGDAVELPSNQGSWGYLFETGIIHGKTVIHLEDVVHAKLCDDNQNGNGALTTAIMTYLSGIVIKVSVTGPGGGFIGSGKLPDVFYHGYEMSAACALAIAIYKLNTDDDRLIYVLVRSPPEVISDLVRFEDGIFVDKSTAMAAFKFIPSALVDRSDLAKGMYAAACADVLTVFFRHYAGPKGGGAIDPGLKVLQAYLSGEILTRISGAQTSGSDSALRAQMRQAIKFAAISCSIVMAAALKYTIKFIRETDEKDKRNIAVIESFVSLLSLAPHVPGIAVTALRTAVVAVYKHYHASNEGLKVVIDDLIANTIYWPLIDKHNLPLTTVIVDDDILRRVYQDYFELVIRSNHL
jgi:hypothetical protein